MLSEWPSLLYLGYVTSYYLSTEKRSKRLKEGIDWKICFILHSNDDRKVAWAKIFFLIYIPYALKCLQPLQSGEVCRFSGYKLGNFTIWGSQSGEVIQNLHKTLKNCSTSLWMILFWRFKPPLSKKT